MQLERNASQKLLGQIRATILDFDVKYRCYNLFIN